MSISSEFTCKCGKQKGWITEAKETKPCPECGRIYIGKYSYKDLTINAIEIICDKNRIGLDKIINDLKNKFNVWWFEFKGGTRKNN